MFGRQYLFSLGKDNVLNCHNLNTGNLYRSYHPKYNNFITRDLTCYFVSTKAKSLYDKFLFY